MFVFFIIDQTDTVALPPFAKKVLNEIRSDRNAPSYIAGVTDGEQRKLVLYFVFMKNQQSSELAEISCVNASRLYGLIRSWSDNRMTQEARECMLEDQ